MILLARIPVLERLVGFDRLTGWHRWNGHVCIDLVIAHVVFTVWGYALLDKFTLGKEIRTMLGGGIYPGMITATIGTALLLAVVVDLARDRPPPALATSGGTPSTSWRTPGSRSPGSTRSRPATSSCSTGSPPTTGAALFIATIVVLVGFRVVAPARRRVPVPAARRRGDRGGAPASSRCTITGRKLDRLRARAGPVLPLALPRRAALVERAPVLALGGARRPLAPDHGQGARRPSARLGEVPARDARVAEGPFGVFTDGAAPARQDAADRRRDRDHADPRAARARCTATSSSLYRVVSDEDDVIFRDELERLAAERGARRCTSSSATTRRPRAAICSRRRTCASSSPTSPSATSSSAARPR